MGSTTENGHETTERPQSKYNLCHKLPNALNSSPRESPDTFRGDICGQECLYWLISDPFVCVVEQTFFENTITIVTIHLNYILQTIPLLLSQVWPQLPPVPYACRKEGTASCRHQSRSSFEGAALLPGGRTGFFRANQAWLAKQFSASQKWQLQIRTSCFCIPVVGFAILIFMT